ncbi:AraC family transcriptional regulator [Oscillatoria laete-virens NRMC-F 0139]|nr:AraC family transcriptional regulator [Oscillatoria laete-virens]MDL5052974.1 AraC family transcriptional regulator [Oscillatoria laete-virens NRMC-F 0139]
MTDSLNAPLWGIPYGHEIEEARSARYRHDNALRKKAPYVIVQWSVSGTGFFSLAGKAHPVPPHHLFIAVIPEKSEYYCDPAQSTPWRFRWVNFTGAPALDGWSKLRGRFGAVVPLPPESRTGKEMRELIVMAEKREFRDEYQASLLSYRVLVGLWQQLSHPSSAERDVIDWAIETMRARYSLACPVKELAAQAGMSREHFTRLFSERTGLPPAIYLRHLRIEAVETLLHTSVFTLGEIAHRCGFSSLGHLRSTYLSVRGKPLRKRG